MNFFSNILAAVGNLVDTIVPFGHGNRTKVSAVVAVALPKASAILCLLVPSACGIITAAAPAVATIAASLVPVFAAAGLVRAQSVATDVAKTAVAVATPPAA